MIRSHTDWKCQIMNFLIWPAGGNRREKKQNPKLPVEEPFRIHNHAWRWGEGDLSTVHWTFHNVCWVGEKFWFVKNKNKFIILTFSISMGLNHEKKLELKISWHTPFQKCFFSSIDRKNPFNPLPAAKFFFENLCENLKCLSLEPKNRLREHRFMNYLMVFWIWAAEKRTIYRPAVPNPVFFYCSSPNRRTRQ